MKRIALLVLAVFVLSSSGCTTPVSSGPGIIIESFQPDVSQIYATEGGVIISMRLKNSGLMNGVITNIGLSGIDKQNIWTVGGSCDGMKGSLLLSKEAA